MAHEENSGKMEFQNAHIRVLNDGTFILEEMFEKKRKNTKPNGPVECMTCERLEYSYESVDDLLKDLGDDLRGFEKKKTEDSGDGEDLEVTNNLKKITKKSEEDEDE